ncbi:MAG: hypothetical protein NUV88_02750 [Candidatus Kaiserbacteria bacterium]|nr:hypothetical protein [Candidatus Kaiserbacteria bacterium]
MSERMEKNSRESEHDKESLVVRELSDILERFRRAGEGIYVLEKVFAKPDELPRCYDKLPGKYREILGVAVFALASQTGILPKVENYVSPLPMVESSAMKLQKVVGFDIAGEASKIGRRVKPYISGNESSRTIIHIGQTHSTTQSVNYGIRGEISKSQSEIAKFLLATTTQNQHVFVEGYSQKYVEDTQEHREAVTKITKASSYAEIRSLYEIIVKQFSAPLQVALLNKVTGDKLASIGFREVSPLTYAKDSDVFTLLESGLFPSNKSYTVPNSTQSLVAGGADVLDVEGRIRIVPAETSEGNRRPDELASELREKGKLLGKLFISFDPNNTYYKSLDSAILPSISQYSSADIRHIAREEPCKKSVECQSLATEILQKDIPAIEKSVMREREEIAVNLIAFHAQTSEQKVFPLVYGSDHNFVTAVEKWNEMNPGYKFNLVSVK